MKEQIKEILGRSISTVKKCQLIEDVLTIPSKRYFLVSIATIINHHTCHGNLTITTDGGYVTNKTVAETVKALRPDLAGVVTTNIIELSEADYNDWLK